MRKVFLLALFAALVFGPTRASGWIDSTLFSPKLFIENKGQFDNAPYLRGFPQVLFAVNHANSKTFFSKNKIAYTLAKRVRDEEAFAEFIKEEGKRGDETQRELDEEEILKARIFKVNIETVFSEWVGADPSCYVEPSQVANEYFNYGMDKDIRHDINFVKGYKRLVYKNIYDGIDIEYTFHERNGIKYNIIVHPGADLSKIKLKYSGGRSVSLDQDNNVIIKTAFGNIIDHSPVSFQDGNGRKIRTKFILNNNILSFEVEDYDRSKALIIDPWITNPITQPDTAYEIAVDPAGNVFVYGDFDSEVKKYNNAGVAQWTFLSGPGYLYNATVIGGDLAVDPAGNSYCSGSECIRKLSPAGASTWLYSPMRNITNIACCETGWRLVFDATNNRLYGGGSNGQTKATWYDPATGNPEWLPKGFNACNIIPPICPSSCPNSNGEIRHICRAPNGNFYGYTAIGDNNPLLTSKITGFDPNFTAVYQFCGVPASPYFTNGPLTPGGPATYYFGCYYMANGIAASNCFIYIHTGDQVYKYDIYSPTLLGSTAIPGGVPQQSSGTLADLANNFYVGTMTGISAYNPAMSLITSVATPKPVHDIAFAPGNTIAACGIGFVGVFGNIVQSGSPITCNPSPNIPMTADADSTPATGCNNNNATAWVDTIMNGSGPYTYTWSNGASTSAISNLGAGTYSCTIIDSSCPKETTTVVVTILSASGFVTTLTSTPNLCFGNSNGSANVNASGGSAPYTYSWNPSGQSGATASGLSAGTYSVLITDATGCTSTKTVSVTQPTAISTTVSSTSASCAGANGSAHVNASGGTGSYTYSWNPSSQISQTASGLAAGDYSVTVTDANGCTNSATVAVTLSASLTATTSITNASCVGNNGSASVASTNGTPPFTYSWSNGQTSQSVTGLAAGNYSVTVTDAVGCSTTSTITITQSASLTASVTSTAASCGGNSGTATISSGSGTSPYTYNWSNGQTSQTASNLAAGNYSVIISDASGCSAANSVVVASSGSITASAVNSAVCAGQVASLSAAGGTAYSWSNGGTGNLIYVFASVTTTYTVIVTSGTCSDTVTATVFVGPGPTAAAWNNVTITAGNNVTLASSGGTNYLWSTGQSTSVISASPMITTVYCVTVTDTSGCTDTACVTVYIEPYNCGYSDDQLFVPDAFSPNNDGKNDKLGVYFPDISCIKELQFIVYDRWGEKVFEADNLSVLWDGTFNGKLMNTAVFVYYMKVVFIDGHEVIRKGNVSLIR